MRIALLASGSSGNALLVQAGSTSVLVDAGISARRLSRTLRQSGVEADSVDAVLLTHGHADHTNGLGTLSARHAHPVYATQGTLGEVAWRLAEGCPVRAVVPGRPFAVGELEVLPFEVSHDSAEPVGFSISDGRARVTVATDLGTVSPPVRRHLSSSDCVVLESNHDEKMLLDGPYPWHLKQRILADTGHLSNGAAAREIERVAGGPLRVLVLAHLSRRNNTPALALAAAREALDRAARPDVTVTVGDQFEVVGPLDATSGVPQTGQLALDVGERCTRSR
jgi:phosphoribosyl 1,2-cyclic phosphodiesterase